MEKNKNTFFTAQLCHCAVIAPSLFFTTFFERKKRELVPKKKKSFLKDHSSYYVLKNLFHKISPQSPF